MSRFQLGLQNLDFPLTAYEFHCQSSSLPTTMLPTFLLVTLLDVDFDEATRYFPSHLNHGSAHINGFQSVYDQYW